MFFKFLIVLFADCKGFFPSCNGHTLCHLHHKLNGCVFRTSGKLGVFCTDCDDEFSVSINESTVEIHLVVDKICLFTVNKLSFVTLANVFLCFEIVC